MVNRKLKKAGIITAIVIGSLILLLVVVASPVTKYIIEKYDEQITGRQIELDWAYVNPLTGYVHLRNFKVYESKSNNLFFSARGLTVNLSVTKLLSKIYEISKFAIIEPRIRIIQNGDQFNFSDMVEKFASDSTPKTSTEPVRFSIKNIGIQNGEFHYNDQQAPINYFVKEFNFDSEGLTWDSDSIIGNYSFLSGPGSGSIKGNFYFNLKSKDYRVASLVEKFDLKIIEQYMKDMANYGRLQATMDANLQLTGNLNDTASLTSKGRIAINNFHFGKAPGDDYMSFDKLILKLTEINLQKGFRLIDSVMLVRPVIKYERYDKLDNIQRMFGEKGSNIDSVKSDPEKFNLVLELADLIKMLSETFTKDYFKINKFAIQDAKIQFNDFSLTEKFSMSLNPFTISADSIDKNRERITIKMKTLIQPHGQASAQLSVNPKNKGYFDLSYKFEKIPASAFNPYLVSFTSFPLDRGTVEFHGNWNVDNSVINSENHFLIIDPRVTKKVRRKDTKWIPMPLIMGFVRERGNVIDYNIPIKGNLKDPKFKLRDVFSDLFENIFVKPPASPYIFEVKNTENELEKSLVIKWEMRKAELLENQQRFIERIAEFLEENKEAAISVNPLQYIEKEKEHILLFEAKKKYYSEKNNKSGKELDEDDMQKIEKMSVKDSVFVAYLDRYAKDSSLFTIQEKARVYVGNSIIQAEYNELIRKRETEFLKYFKENGTENRVKILRTDNAVPFNGFSFYRINYKGDIPDELMEAYQKMEEFNSEDPRKQYKRWRG